MNEFEFCAKYGVTPTEAEEMMITLLLIADNHEVINTPIATNEKQTITKLPL